MANLIFLLFPYPRRQLVDMTSRILVSDVVNMREVSSNYVFDISLILCCNFEPLFAILLPLNTLKVRVDRIQGFGYMTRNAR